MAFRSLVTSLFLAFLLPFVAHARAPQTSQTAHVSLTITCDADCGWNVDDDQHGTLRKGEEARVEVLFGAHKVEARSSDGKLWEKTIEIVEPKPEQIRISFATSPRTNDQIKTSTTDKTLQTAEPAGEIPRFYAQSRQVLIEAKVWETPTKKNREDTSWIPNR